MDTLDIVFLPGLLCDERLWRDQVAGVSTFANTYVADLTQDNNITAMAARTLANAPDRFALVGLSMGGYVAFEIMRQAPDRVTNLVLFDTSAAPDTPERRAQRQDGINALKVGKFAGVTSKLIPQLIHKSRINGPVAQDVREMAERVGADAYIRQQEAIMARQDSRPTLSQIKIPTLVAVGDSDVLTPLSDALQIHHGINGSYLHVFKDCGHLPVLEMPEESTAVLCRWFCRT